MIEIIRNIFIGLGFGVLGMIMIFLLYTIFRILFSAIFRSYFEEKRKTLTGGKNNEEE